MSSKQIEEQVIKALRNLGCDAEEILPVHELQFHLGIDSTEMVELAALVRSECGITAERIDLSDVRTVAEMAAKVESLVAGANARPAAGIA